MVKNIFVLLFVINSVTIVPQGAPSLLDSLIINSTKYIELRSNTLSGDGWNELVTKSKKSKYVLIGEDHGFSEIPYFTNKLSEAIDFDVFVSEIDSVTASIMKRVLKTSYEAQNVFHNKNPSALSFFSALEEYNLAKKLQKKNVEFWGLDQVSLFSTGLLYKEMATISRNQNTKNLLAQIAKASDSLFIEAIKTENYDKLYIFNKNEKHFKNVKNLIKKENHSVKKIFSEIYTSWKIYNNIDRADHTTRIGKMKEKLLNYYFNNQKKNDKFLFKFGANHLLRGESLTNSYDIGNLVQNVAHAEGESSFHIMIVGKQGTMNTFLPSKEMNIKPFDIVNDSHFLNYLYPFIKNIKNDTWKYFDLLPMRKLYKSGKLKLENKLLVKTINGYDALIIIPKVTASKLIK